MSSETTIRDGMESLFVNFLADTRRLAIVHGSHTNPSLFSTFLKTLRTHVASVTEFHSTSILAPVSSELATLFDPFDTVLYVEGTASTHSRELTQHIAASTASTKYYRLFDFSPQLFQSAFNVSRTKLEALNAELIQIGQSSSSIHVESPKGTCLSIALGHYGWINSCGAFRNGKPATLPVSEVATYSAAVNGTLIADGAINTNFGFYGTPILQDHHVTLRITDSVVTHAHCKNVILQTLIDTFLLVPNARRIGEVGFGTNIGLGEFVPFVSHINERYPSLHIGLGSHNQGTILDWHCPLHFDFILRDCTIWFDKNLVHQNGNYFVSTETENNTRCSQSSSMMGYTDTL